MPRYSTLLRVLLLLLLLPGGLWAEQPSRELPEDEGPWVVRAWYDQRSAVNRLARRTAPWQVRHDQGFVVVAVRNRYEYQQLLQDGFRALVEPTLTALLRQPLGELRSLPGFACYRTVEESLAAIEDIAAAHPGLASFVDIGDSWERSVDPMAGHPLRVLRLSNAAIAGDKPRLFLLGAIHAREYATAELLLRFAEDLLMRYPEDADVRWMLDHHEVHLLPQGNPDGRKQAEGGLLWRKTTNQNYCGASSSFRGADLNRNFPFEWGSHGGSSGDPCDETYRGPLASSEPEATAITEYLRSLFPPSRPPDLVTPADPETAGVFIDVHSYGEVLLWPWGFTANPAPDALPLLHLGRRLAWFNDYLPITANGLYTADGTSDDFVYGELGVPAFTLELGEQFFEPCSGFESRILPDNLRLLHYALRVARRPYRLPSGPSIRELGAAPVEPGETIRVLVDADDGVYATQGEPTPVQPVQDARLYRDTPPFLSGAVALPLHPADGLLDQSREWMYADLSSDGLAVGRHPVYAEAEDGEETGPPMAAFVEVLAAGSSGLLQGRLLDANSGEPLAVPGVVRLGASASLTVPTEGSQYRLRALPGNHAIEVQAEGYAPRLLPAQAFTAGASTTLDFALQPICTILADDASAGFGTFQPQAPWGLDASRFVSAPFAFSASPGVDYAPNADSSLTSVSLDLRDFVHVHLRFQSWCDTEVGGDFGRVEFSLDGSPWSQLWSCSGEFPWRQVEVPVPMFDGEANARIRFRFTSNASVEREGWSIDDIELRGAGPLCAGPSGALFANGFE